MYSVYSILGFVAMAIYLYSIVSLHIITKQIFCNFQPIVLELSNDKPLTRLTIEDHTDAHIIEGCYESVTLRRVTGYYVGLLPFITKGKCKLNYQMMIYSSNIATLYSHAVDFLYAYDVDIGYLTVNFVSTVYLTDIRITLIENMIYRVTTMEDEFIFNGVWVRKIRNLTLMDPSLVAASRMDYVSISFV